MNDSKLIITSLNFYEYSMIHNKEIGVLYDVNTPGDQEIYSKALEHIKFIEDNSNDKPFGLNSGNAMQSGKVGKPDESKQHRTNEVKKDKETKSTEKKFDKQTGYCIRTGVEIPFNIEKPMSYEAFKVWSQFGDPDYPEKFCHFSGEPSNGETSVSKPILKKNWKKAKEIFDF